jgi:MOSC domain-containing protein YiiM
MSTLSQVRGRIASFHLHPAAGGAPLESADVIELEAERGIRGDQRYFGRKSRSTGGPSKRQVTVIEREVLQRHADALSLDGIAPGIARSNIETEGIDLSTSIGRRLRVGTAVLEVVEPREPCEKMEAIAPGLRALMTPPCQGIIARVIESGTARVGDAVELI